MNKNGQEYRINRGRIFVLLAALLNIFLSLYITYRFVYDDSFIKNQIGLTFNLAMTSKYIIATLIILVSLYINYMFLKKNILYKHLLGLIQTIVFAFILKNIAVVYAMFGLQVEKFGILALGFLVMSLAIYITLFSYEALLYFGLEKKKN